MKACLISAVIYTAVNLMPEKKIRLEQDSNP